MKDWERHIWHRIITFPHESVNRRMDPEPRHLVVIRGSETMFSAVDKLVSQCIRMEAGRGSHGDTNSYDGRRRPRTLRIGSLDISMPVQRPGGGAKQINVELS